MRTAVIVNPNAGGGRVGRSWPAMQRIVEQALGPFTPHFTTGPGDGTRRCQAALAQGAGLIVALGGDGTASEVAAGMLAEGAGPRSGVALGVLPGGTGCDLRRTLGGPATLREAAQAIAAAPAREIDAGVVDHVGHDGAPVRTHFVNVAGFGIGGLGDQLVNRSRKPLGAKIAYLSALVGSMVRYRNARVAYRLDDGPEEAAVVYHVALANGGYFGSGMNIAPGARIDDGLLDLVVLGDLGTWEAVALGPAMYRGRHVSHPKVRVGRGQWLHARAVNPAEHVLLEIDGECPGRLPASFRVLPRALLLRG